MEITKIQRQQLDELRKKRGLELILLHGSQAQGKVHSQSDIDIAIYGDKGDCDNLGKGELITELVEIFHSDKVDVANLTRAHPLLLKTVTDKAVILSGERVELEKLKLKAFHRYNDYRPFFRIEQQTVNKQFGVS